MEENSENFENAVKKVEDKADSINLNFNISFFKNKKFQLALVIVLFALIAIFATSMRLSNVPLLVDHTTGNYTLSDPDAMFWMRLEGQLLDTGSISGVDTMRNPGLNVHDTQELLVYLVVDAYKVIHNFNPSISYQFIDVIYPAYAFLIALAIFFFLIYFLTKSKTAALIGSFFIAYSPAFLFRTIAGVSGHEALGTMFLFATFLSFVLSLKEMGKNKTRASIYGVLTGFLITLSFVSWGGTINFILLIFPIALFLFYLFNLRDSPQKKANFFLFYIIMIVTALISTLFFHYHPSDLYRLFFLSTGILVPAVLLFTLIDSVPDYFNLKKSYFEKWKDSKARLLISGVITLILGIILLGIAEGNLFGVFGQIYTKLIHPLSQDRVALTVAYYAQPYLTDFISQASVQLFWLFIIGTSFMLIEIFSIAKTKKEKFYLSLTSVLSIIAIIFSRYSSSSVLNGVDFLSQLIYFLGFIGILVCLIYIYIKNKEKINTNLIFLFSWMIVMLITIRAAQRTIFLVVPYMVAITSYLFVRLYKLYKKSSKKEGMKYFIGIFLVIVLILSFGFFFGNPTSGTPGAIYNSNLQAANTGPLMNTYWQNAMSWVRNNTASDSVFLSWWDYGYQIQTAGHRTTVLDGGNYNAYWDYLMGRYVLTTPNPATAKSFMKEHNVSYLLIDPTDVGKYAAFSSIGNAANVSDRASYLPTLVSDPKQTQETNNGTTRLYQGGFALDSDLILNSTSGPVLLPEGTAGLYGIFVTNTNQSYTQPIGVYIYNNQQYQAPIRYLYISGQLLDFGSGVNATVYIYPNVYNNQFDMTGAAMYLSAKTQDSLFVDLYLMNDTKNEYPELKLEEVAGAYPFNFYYNVNGGGFQGPIRIWYVNRSEMTNIIARPEFMATAGIYGGDDNLTFTTGAGSSSNAPMIPANFSS